MNETFVLHLFQYQNDALYITNLHLRLDDEKIQKEYAMDDDNDIADLYNDTSNTLGVGGQSEILKILLERNNVDNKSSAIINSSILNNSPTTKIEAPANSIDVETIQWAFNQMSQAGLLNVLGSEKDTATSSNPEAAPAAPAAFKSS